MNPTPRANQFWLIVLAALWAFYGLVGRDAWKGEEALALAAVLDWLAGTSSAWATPAPLYTLVAGWTAQLATGHWDVQDGARLASGVFTLLALLFAGMTARSLHGPGHGAAAVLALACCMGLMLRVHALLPETALLAGWSALLYGVAVARQHARRGAVVIALALAILTLGLRGVLDLVAGLLVVGLPLLSAPWRTREYRRAALAGVGLALAIIAVCLGLLAGFDLLRDWLHFHGPGRYALTELPTGPYSQLAWFAWPLWPLAAWAVWHAHHKLARTPELHPSLIALAVLLLTVPFPIASRDGALLLVMLPLAPLAAFAVNNLRRGAAQAFYWFGVLCLLFFSLAAWAYFFAIEWGMPTRLAQHLAKLAPGYAAGSVETGALLFALTVSLLWLIAIPLFPRAKTRPLLVWATGMALLWILLAALFRPWAEYNWGYRPLIADMARHLPQGACLDARVDAPMQVMLRYHLAPPAQADCAWTLRLVERRATRAEAGEAEAAQVIWEGFRPRHKSQVYRLQKHGGE